MEQFQLRAHVEKAVFPMSSSLTSVTMRCTTPMCVIRRDLTSAGQSMGNSATSPWETATSASSGQGKNQSIVGPEINPGNFLYCVGFEGTGVGVEGCSFQFIAMR